MRSNIIIVVVLATIGLVCVNVAYAYPPSYSDEPPAVNDSGGYNGADDGDDDDNNNGGYAIPQFNFGYAQQHEHEQQQQQYPVHTPSVTYFTTSKTSSTSTSTTSGASSSSSSSVSPPQSSEAISATSTKPSLQSAYVYKAEVPAHIEPEANKVVNAVKLASSTVAAAGQSSSSSSSSISNTNTKSNSEKDNELSKKIIGSSVVTSVSVILNGDEPQFTDALGQKVPKPQPSLQVASPIDLLNPDRYEFYTFDEHGELVKRLMTMEEIQSIVANGDGEGPTIIHHGPIEDRDPEKNVQDIVDSVQNVLNKEVESNKNTTINGMPIFDTPDVSSSWSMILPAIFGNTGDVDIFPQQKPQQIVMIPDTEIIETSTKIPPSTTTKKPKPSKRKPGQKRKPTTSTTEMTPQVIQEELESHESVYTGMQQYQNLAAAMENYDGFSQMHMQPIYNKLPAIETTTRRVFINNEEVVKKPIISNDDEVKLNENLGKKPTTVQHKPIPPHRIKKPNGGQTTTKRPQGTKQKIKRKPTTTTTTTPIPTTTEEAVTTTSEEPTTTTTNVAPTTTTSTTTTSTTTTTPQPEPITTTEIIVETPSSTSAPKKKKKKPTRQPIHSSTSTAHGSSTKPHLTAEKRKPSPKPHRPRPTQAQHTKYPHTTTSSDLAAEGSAHQEVSHNKYQQVTYHRPRPKPNRHTTKSTTTTTSTTPMPEPSTTVMFAPVPAHIPSTPNPVETSLIVQEFPGYQPSLNNYGETVLTRRTTKKPEMATSANIPSTSGTSGYPIPSYGITIDESENTENNQYKKQPLPSLAMTQHTSKPYEQDIHTLESFDQIMQSLKQPDQLTDKIGEEETTMDSKIPAMKPTKYDSAENEDQLEELDNKHKITVQNAMPITTTTTTSTTTNRPLHAHYGGSTLATTLIDVETTTDSSSSEETTISEENNTPVVVITARPQYLVSTHKPQEITTNIPNLHKEIETTELPSYTPFVDNTEKPTTETEIPETTVSISEMKIEQTTEYPIIQQDSLYAEEPHTIVHEISTEAPKQPSHAYAEETTTEENSLSDEITEKLNIQTRIPVTVPHKVDSIISDDREVSHPILVADLKPQLNMEVVKPSEQISMSDFQTQAATVASTLVDGSNTIAADYTMMSSNETKDEIAFLMSDVIKQISNNNDRPKIEQTNDNRYSNQAQLNLSFLMKPNKEELKQPSLMASYGSEATNDKQKLDHKPILERLEDSSQLNGTPVEEYATHRLTTSKPETTTIPTTQKQEINMEFTETTTQIPDQMNTDEDSKTSEESTSIEEFATTTLSSYLESQSTEDITTNLPQLVDEQTKKQTANEDKTSTVFEEESTTPEILMESVEESTTFKTPILSLSEIYAQQQKQDETDHREALFEADSAIDTTTIINNLSEETTDNPAYSSNEDEIKKEVENNKSTTSESLSTDDQVTESEEHTNSQHKKDKIGDAMVTTDISTETSEEDKMDTSEMDSVTIKIESTEGQEDNISTEQATEATAAITSKYDESASTEQSQSQMAEDSETNATDLEPQHFTEVATESTIKEDIDSLETTTQLISSKEEDHTDVNMLMMEDSKESAEATTINYQMSEETSAELNAMISEEDETGESIDEDPYVKLGETTTVKSESSTLPPSTTVTAESETKPIIQNKEEIKSQETLSSEKEQMLSPPKPIPAIIDNDVPTGTLPSMLMGNYGQPFEEADEEDEDDQFGYQAPKLPTPVATTTTTTSTTTTTTTTTPKPIVTTTRRLNTLKPVSYYNKQPAYAVYQDPVEPLYNKQPSLASYTSQQQKQQLDNVPSKVSTYSLPTPQQRPMQRPAQLSNLMISASQATRAPVKLEPSPTNSKGLEASLANLDEDILAFTRLCNELAFSYWKSITSEKISSARSLVISPFALTSMLSMVFLGARGSTSGEMNDVLKLDDMVTFNPHLVFKNITDSVEKAMDSDIATTAFVREIFSDRANGKILQFFKEKTQQLYSGHVEEVNFHVVNDIIRRRTNLLVKRHTMGKVLEYLRTNSVWVNGPLATISANLFQTDCSQGSTHDRDGEIFFQVHPTVRQRRLVPIPAVLFKSGFTAGYEPNLDATVVAFGRIQDTTSMIYVMPGHLSSISPSDNLDRLEKELMETAISKNAWSNLLTSLMDRPGMEVQLPRFSHRSFVNATLGLQKMGLKGLFKSDYADLGGLTGSSNRDIYLSDMIQINTFSTCGEEKIADHHHVEMYPAPPLRKRNKDVDAHDDEELDSSEAIIDFGSLVQDSALGRGFYDDLLDPKYLELPLPLRPRQARVPDAPRLRFDKPFLYFVRHNPTGMILFMGRFNPRLLP